MFTVADYALLCLYLAVLTWVGAKYYRKSSSSAEFFAGGRAMSWLPVAISVIAADTSVVTILGNPGYAYDRDLRLVFYVLAYSVAAWLVIPIFLPFYCRLNMYTAYEYLEQRFDVRVRIITSALFLFIRGAHVSIAIYAPAIILSLISGIPLYTAVLLMGVFTTIYTTLGGIRAVIWTDVIQFSIVALGILTTFILTINTVEGGLPAISQIGSEFGKWRLFDFSFDITSDHSFWAMFVGGIILAVATMGTDQAILQRYFTAQSERECSRSLKFFSVLLIPYNCLLILIGVFLFAFYHQNPDLARDLPQSDAVLGHFAVHQLPRFMGTLLIGAIFAASMGAMSAGINSLATCTVVDFYQRLLKPNEPDPHYVRAGRFCTVLWGVLTTLGALYADRLGQLALAFGKIQGFVGGVMLGIFLLGIFFRRANASGALAGTLVAMTIVTYVAFWTDISFFWYGAIGSSLTILVGYLWSMTGPHPSGVPETLFFQGTRK